MKTRRQLKQQAQKQDKKEKKEKPKSPKSKPVKKNNKKDRQSSSSSSPQPLAKKNKRNRTESNTQASKSPKKRVNKDKADKSDSSKKHDKKEKVKKKTPSKTKYTNRTKSPSPKKKSPAKNSSQKKMKTIKMSGSIPVDQQFCLGTTGYHVLEDQGKVYSATLNQTKVVTNNNKYYILQIIQNSSNPNLYYFWTRWGRVGAKGQNSNMPCSNKMIAIRLYNQKFHEKHVRGDYKHLQLKYDDDEDEKDKEDDKADQPIKQRVKDFTQSSLHNDIKHLLKLIFDTQMMDKQMKQIGYDSKRMPLGKLSPQTIKKGYTALKQLMQQILKKKSNQSKIEQLNNTFYSYIPHDFGFSKMKHHILRQKAQVQRKLEMLQSLENITVARKLLKSNQEDTNIIDQNYAKLDRDLNVVDKNSREFEICSEYLSNTHAKTHNSYSLKIQNIFKLAKKKEDDAYRKQIGNKMLLWHGSRLTNYVGILSQGLRIAPPEAPVTGYMFGKGVYFADMVSKSANYCFTNPSSNTGLMLLCEVALGEMNQKTQSDYYANLLPPGKSSTKGVGRTYPPTDSYVQFEGVQVPIGEPETLSTMQTSLLYNQYIVYNVDQIKLKYLLRVKFNYKN